jgi:hypothetical protein
MRKAMRTQRPRAPVLLQRAPKEGPIREHYAHGRCASLTNLLFLHQLPRVLVPTTGRHDSDVVKREQVDGGSWLGRARWRCFARCSAVIVTSPAQTQRHTDTPHQIVLGWFLLLLWRRSLLRRLFLLVIIVVVVITSLNTRQSDHSRVHSLIIVVFIVFAHVRRLDS